jgi:thiamine kinase-like enzyme
MAQELSENVQQLDPRLRVRLSTALSTWQRWSPAPVAQPSFVAKLCGITNASIRVSDGSNHWVIRFNQAVADPGIHRASEFAAMRLAADKGICPAPVYIQDDILVTPYWSGEQPGFGQLKLIGETFATIHQLDPRLYSESEQLKMLDELELSSYLMTCFRSAGEPKSLQTQLQRVIEILPSEPKVLCHNDMLFENLLYSPAEQRIHVLDWEYAKVAPPSFDIATFSSHYCLSDDHLQLLLRGYDVGGNTGASSDHVNVASVRSFEAAAALIEKLWYLVKAAH